MSAVIGTEAKQSGVWRSDTTRSPEPTLYVQARARVCVYVCVDLEGIVNVSETQPALSRSLTAMSLCRGAAGLRERAGERAKESKAQEREMDML